MLTKNNTILLAFPPGTTPHLHIVLSEPAGNPPYVILVNLSSCKGRPQEDHTVVLKQGDHPYISRDCYVAYDYAKTANLDALTQIIENGNGEMREDISDELHERIGSGLLQSRRTPNKVKKAYRAFISSS